MSSIRRHMSPSWFGNCKRKHVCAMQMATLEHCFAASGDVEETPACSCLPANMLMFTALNVESDGKIWQITHRAFPPSLRTRHQSSRVLTLQHQIVSQGFSWTLISCCKDFTCYDEAPPDQRGSRTTWRQSQICFANEVSGNRDYFWQGSVILQWSWRGDSSTQPPSMCRKWP